MSENLEAFRLEAEALTRAAAGFSEREWSAPTRCAPWTALELLGHVRVAVGRLPSMLAAPAPAPVSSDSLVSAAGYYRPDERFAPATNADRVDLGRAQAAEFATAAGLVEDFGATCRRVEQLCRAEPAGRVVVTRHGDPMLLEDFLVTRVIELAVHGLDLADAVGRQSWLTTPAAEVVTRLLTGAPEPPGLGWDHATFLRKATGRAPLTADETARAEHIHWLTLG
ncbi:maleylpyruvate isomerase N-terminal domain-containing protein [Actinoplanes sp. NPDC049596]|uniref:maleylpyruvate isomerase N-terminal domain-containing protein n=1 Tax=unclassified Actinoplanes TaxID=2626549 RepID=UPI00341979A4